MKRDPYPVELKNFERDFIDLMQKHPNIQLYGDMSGNIQAYVKVPNKPLQCAGTCNLMIRPDHGH